MRFRRIRGFTLLELLIVVAIVGILAGLILGAISSARSRVDVAVAKTHMRTIEIALTAYQQDQGRYPRLAPVGNATVYNDDGPALYAALMNRPTQTLGGGANSPYLDGWEPRQIGVIENTYLAANSMGNNGTQGTGVTELAPADHNRVSLPSFQQGYPATGAGDKLVLLDPWGGPYHYREWASVRVSTKDALLQAPQSRTVTPAQAAAAQGQPPVPGPVPDTPHNLETFDIWSNGPNGINENGAQDSDDVASWSDAR